MIKLADGRRNLYQWDTGRQVECDAEQVHFSNHHYGVSIDVDVKDGKAMIPNQLLISAIPLKAWAWVKDDNGEYTREEQIFLVAERNKPSDYVYTPTEIKTWQDLQNQIGDLGNLKTEHKDNLVNAINDAAGSGGGASTAEEVGYANDALPDVTNVKQALDNTIGTQQTQNGEISELKSNVSTLKPQAHTHNNKATLDKLAESDGNLTYDGKDIGGGASSAEDVSYENDSMPTNVYNVKQALDFDADWLNNIDENVNSLGDGLSTLGGNVEVLTLGVNDLESKSHTHTNKPVLDKLTDSNGRLKYGGNDIASALVLTGSNGEISASYTAVENELNAAQNIVLKYNNDSAHLQYWEKSGAQVYTLFFETAILVNNTFVHKVYEVDVTPSTATISAHISPGEVTEGTNISLADNTEYRLTDVTTLTLTYPTGNFECWLKLTFAESGSVTVTLPTGTKYIGNAPSFANGEAWEMSVKDGVVIAQKVGDGT